MTDNQPNRQEARAWAEKVAKSKPPRYTSASRNAAAVILAEPLDDPRVVALVRLCGLYFGGLSSNANAGGVYARDIRAALAALEPHHD